MRNRLTRKLALYFSIALITFALIVGGLFLVLFSHHTIEINKQVMEQRAESIAGKLSDYMQRGTNQKGHGHGDGFGSYLRSLNEADMGEVWVVDKDANTLELKCGHNEITYSVLPDEAKKMIKEVFQGKTVITESFNEMFNVPTVTAGAPVYSSDGDVLEAVLIHADVAGLNRGAGEGLRLLLISLAVALAIAVLFSFLLAARFIRPLKNMEKTAKQLADGDYTTRTGIEQDDEIGSLAKHIDILAGRLWDAQEERKNFDQVQQDFIASVSHELRTPVTVIRGSLELLSDGLIKPEDMQEYFEQMLKDSIHLQRMVNDLLELSKLQNSDYKMEMSPVDMQEVIKDAARSIRGVAAEKEVQVKLSDTDQCMEIQGDYGRLKQMFLVALDNAVKFSQPGGSVEIRSEYNTDVMLIEIKDYGAGIPEAEQKFIFEKFYHANKKDNQEGSGLGLAVAKKIADRHGIEILCESAPGESTVFRFVKRIAS